MKKNCIIVGLAAAVSAVVSFVVSRFVTNEMLDDFMLDMDDEHFFDFEDNETDADKSNTGVKENSMES